MNKVELIELLDQEEERLPCLEMTGMGQVEFFEVLQGKMPDPVVVDGVVIGNLSWRNTGTFIGGLRFY